MRARGARAEPDHVDRLGLETGALATGTSASTGPASAAPAATRAGPSLGARRLTLTLLSTVSTLAVAAHGLETGRKSVAMVGLVFTALVAVVLAAMARTAIRADIRSRKARDRALARCERAREELRLANARLQRRNADLQAFQLAVAHGFDVINERTEGRLKELVEEAGDELAGLVDDALDDPTEDAW